MHDSGQAGGHDFSGAHDRVESAHEGGQAGGGGGAHAFAGDKTPGHGAGGGAVGEGGAAGGHGQSVPAPTVGRAAAAGADRHGVGARPGAAYLRRTHHGAGCDQPAGHCGADFKAGGGARYRAVVYHPRPGLGRTNVRAGIGDEGWPGCGRGPRRQAPYRT